MELVHVVGSRVDCVLSRSQILLVVYQIAREIVISWSCLVSANIVSSLRSDGLDSLVLVNRA